MVFFDYLFYRFAIWFYRTDGRFAARALIAVSMVQLAMLWPFVLYSLYYVSGGPGSRHNPKPILLVTLPLWVLVCLLNYRRYSRENSNRFDALTFRWKHDNPRTTIVKTLAATISYFLLFYLSYKATCSLAF